MASYSRTLNDTWGTRGGEKAGVLIGGLASAALLGLLIGIGQPAIAFALLVFGAALGVGLLNWRWPLLGLLAYLPFAGVPAIALYPNQEPAVLIKDFLFVIPLYVGFLASVVINRIQVRVDGAPTGILLALSALVLAQMLNPELPTIVVGLIGAKVWLFYVPLLYIGYALLRTREDLDRVLGLIVLAGIMPALIGIAEAILIYAGQKDLVYSWYGDAAGSATQDFAALQVGGSTLHRVPSTFSFVTQYFVFCCSMVAVSYAWWRSGRGGRLARFQPAVWGVMVFAGLLSGARGAFLLIPAIVLLILLLERVVGHAEPVRPEPTPDPSARRRARTRHRPPVLPLVLIGGVSASLLTLAVLGASGGKLVGDVIAHTGQQLDDLFVRGFREAFAMTTGGLGTGIDTNASRYVLDAGDLFAPTGGRWEESWWVKALLELGIAGLILLVTLVATLLWRLVGVHARLRDPGLRAVSAALIALLAVMAAYGVKAQYVDFDPLNVYFWLFAGFVLALPRLEREPAGPDPTAAR